MNYSVFGEAVRCKSVANGRHLVISGFHSLDRFQSINCKRNGVITVTYQDCDIDYVELPLAKVKKTYLFVKTVNWKCMGLCLYSKALNIRITGNCYQGNL